MIDFISFFDFIIFYTLQVLAGAIVAITLLGLLPFENWWIRFADFPRLQLINISLVCLVGLSSFLFFDVHSFSLEKKSFVITLLTMLFGALLYQLYMVLPYSRLRRKQVASTCLDDLIDEGKQNGQIKLMVVNVLTPNKNKAALIDQINKHAPDVLLTLETDKIWQDALSTIETDYPYCVKVPLDNLYGMHLYSKFQLINPQVKYLLVDDVPSIHTQLKLPNGKKVWLYCLHPMPPAPMEADKSTTRDAEILMVAKQIREKNETAIVAGDLNDVAWSNTTKRFQRISGLLDPRIGRTFINTFHANLPFLRWALDHVFHSACFSLVNIKRLPNIGSDHFPLLTMLQYDPKVAASQQKNVPLATIADLKQAEHCIARGRVEGVKLSKKALKKQNQQMAKNGVYAPAASENS